MDCERAQAKLKELALTGESALDDLGLADADLAEHAMACPACWSAFERAQVVVTAIDRSVAAAVAENPAPDFVARTRERLAMRAPQRTWRWAQFAAAGALAVAIIAVLAWRHERIFVPSAPVASLGENSSVPPSIATTFAAPLQLGVRAETPARRAQRSQSQREPADFPPVMIAASEREAAARLVNDISSGRVDVASLATEPLPPGPLDAAPIEFAPIDVSPPDVSLHEPPVFVEPENAVLASDDAVGAPESASLNEIIGGQQ
jgi:hypothetical protein